MQVYEILNFLTQSYCQEDWFDSVSYTNKIIIYVKYLSKDILDLIPSLIEDNQILIHFVGSKQTQSKSKSKYIHHFNRFVCSPQTIISKIEKVLPITLKDHIDLLIKKCKKEVLKNILMEIHDGPSATTDDSKSNIEIRKIMETLYFEYDLHDLYVELN